MTSKSFIHAALMLGVLILGGCEDRDPYRRTDVWHPTGAPQANLAAMVANPQDLIRGHGVSVADPKVVNTSISHIWLDTPKPLLDPTGSASGGGGGASGGAGAGAGAGGAAPAGG